MLARIRSLPPAARILLLLALAGLGTLACTSIFDVWQPEDREENTPVFETATSAALTLEAIHRATLDAAVELEISLTATAEAIANGALPAATQTPTPTPTPKLDEIIEGAGFRDHPYEIFDDKGNPVTKLCTTSVFVTLTLHDGGTAEITSVGEAIFDPYDDCSLADPLQVSYEGQGLWAEDGATIVVTINSSGADRTGPGEGQIVVQANKTMVGSYRCFDLNGKLLASIDLTD